MRMEEKIRQMDLDIERLEAEAEGLSVNYEGMPRGTRISDRTGDLAVKIAAAKDERIRMKVEALEARNEVQAVIDAVTDPLFAKILYNRYILCMRWDAISDEVHYDPVYTRTRLHSKALQDASQYIIHM